jgi:hypothetical protein
MYKRYLCLAALALSICGSAFAVNTACIQAAEAQVPIWKSQGKTQEEIETLLEKAVLQCGGASPSLAAYAASANFDLSRFARQFVAHTLPAVQYVMLSRDRGRKLRRAVKDPAWVQAWLLGDADQDMVPDSLDKCPGTPETTPTTDTGCPSTTEPPKMPTEDQIKFVFSHASFTVDPQCTGPLPGVAQPIKAGTEFPFPNFLIGLYHANNQPAGCTLFYEIQIQFSDRKTAAVPPTTTLGVVFAREESTNTSASGNIFQIFKIKPTDNGPRKLMLDTATQYRDKTIKVRVMNGAGLSSGWSAPIKYEKPFFVDLQVQ